MKTAKEVLKSLVADIEAMQWLTPLGNTTHKFGPFDLADTDQTDGVTIEWPNLAILLEEAQKVLGEAD